MELDGVEIGSSSDSGECSEDELRGASSDLGECSEDELGRGVLFADLE